MRTPLDAEGEVAEYLLGLDGLGLTGRAQALYLRCLSRDIRPLLLRQKALLRADGAQSWPEPKQDPDPVEEEAEWVALGEHLREGQTPARTDAIQALDAELVAAWDRLLEQLKTLWLTEGRGVAPGEAA